ncbi:MAG: alpha-glucosidase [Oscillospiraceae bacterium]|jgi:alpha-glucosidase|nr:alpha-glucosidase [Oscillospiraceae bacterium]
MLRVDVKGDKLTVYLGERPVIVHTPDAPFVHVGKGVGRFRAHGGHWRVSDGQLRRTALTGAQYDAGRSAVRFSGGDYSLTFHLSETEGSLILTTQRASTGLNRIWLSFPAKSGQGVYGGGAQYGGLDLRGHRVPLWVHERRVGRESARLPLLRASGHHATQFPHPSFFTQDGLFVYLDSPAYGALDFRDARRHRAELWELPSAVVVGVETEIPALARRMSRVLGHQSVLPYWSVEGVWMEAAGGMPALVARLDKAVSAGVQVSAVCLRDWSGRRETARGPRVFYDWTPNQELYPRLDKVVGELSAAGVRTLAYINPHMAIEGRLFAEASMAGYLVRKPEGGNYINDMGGFMAGHLDLTNPDACAWFKEIIKNNILKRGFSGYMADMGYYLPARGVLQNGESPNRMHNRWPVLWAKLNREAVREAGRANDTVFFTRAGYGGSCGQTMLTTTGEHNAGWGAEDGLPSALTASLTLACSGMGLSLSDIGGNMAFSARRSKEMYLRWAEYAAFTPVMRTVSLPGQLDFDTDEEILALFARLSRLHAALAPYTHACVRENAGEGRPVMRPLFMEFPQDERARRVTNAYMLGGELLVAPVMQRGRRERGVYLPAGNWVHLWSGKAYIGGEHTMDAPLGRPPVFYRPTSRFVEVFENVNDAATNN